MAHLCCKHARLAEEDASESLALDPTYIKAYHRRGAARFALGKYGLALEDLEHALESRPDDPELNEKASECRRRLASIEAGDDADPTTDFTAATFADEEDTVARRVLEDLDSIAVGDSYGGPHLGDRITLDFVHELMEFFEHQGKLHKKYVLQILLWMKAMLKQLPSLVDVRADRLPNALSFLTNFVADHCTR